MSNINNILTQEEINFIHKHNLSIDDFYDARNDNRSEMHDLAKKLGCRFVIYKSCSHGHRLRTRSGHCIVCNPASIAFQKRDSNGGVIYLAKKGKYSKVGMIDNKRLSISIDDLISHREYQLNYEGGYGGIEGWSIIKYWIVAKNAGKIEREAHRLLDSYKHEEMYWYSGELRVANELFKCSKDEAEAAIELAIESFK